MGSTPKRHPIISSENSQGVPIRIVQAPLGAEHLLPTYKFEFQSGKISDEAVQMKSDLTEFIKTNADIALPSDSVDHSAYVSGFQKAVAIVQLWIDSIYFQST